MTDTGIHPATPAWAARLPAWMQAYTRPAMAGMLMLGFASGLPLYLVFQKTSFWLRESGVDLTIIGFFYWVGLFYTFKFVWAPLVDRTDIPGLTARVGHRRSWMMTAIAGTVVALCIIAGSDPAQGLWTILIGALLLAFSGATLDVAIDAWRIESAPSEEQAAMAASYSLGYRGALIFANLSLVIAGFANWHVSFLVMALGMAGTAVLVLLIREPTRRPVADISALPFIAGPWNAVAVATGVFVLARIVRFFGGLGAETEANLAVAAYVLSVAGAAILILGPALFSGTRAGLPLRLALAGAGALFVCAREVALLVASPDPDGPPWFELLVVVISLVAIGLYGWLVSLAFHRAPSAATPAADRPRGKLYVTFGTPFVQVWDRFGTVFLAIIAFVMIYRLSDFTMGVMAVPLYADLGYAKEVVGGLQGGPGLGFTILGLFVGGASAAQFGLKPSLVIGAVLTLITNGFYAYFAGNATGDDPLFLATAICADNLAGGFVTTVFIAYLSSLVDPAFAATQYALFSSLYAFVNKFVAGFSGAMAKALGYETFFLVTASYAIPAAALVFVVAWAERRHPPKPIGGPATGFD